METNRNKNMENKTNKIDRIQKYRESLLPTLYNIQDKAEAIISALEDGASDCEILNDSKNMEFDELMLEMEILQNDITRLDFELNSFLISTSSLLGQRYFDKLAEYEKESADYYVRNGITQHKYSHINNGSGRDWKNNLGKWMTPLFFYMTMMIDENSILNSSVFDKDYINKKREGELEEYLKEEGINMKKENGCFIMDDDNVNKNNDTIVCDDTNDVNSLD
jgi:hypothetical protein